jgi:hypothetical protein
MDIKEVAEMMNNREYLDEMKGIDEEQIKEAEIVIVFGSSDDNVEFKGAIDEEIGAYGGITLYITENGIIDRESEMCGYCNLFQNQLANAKKIEAVWCGDSGYDWAFETDIPHETFDILEEGRKFCRGIVFKLSEVKK